MEWQAIVIHEGLGLQNIRVDHQEVHEINAKGRCLLHRPQIYSAGRNRPQHVLVEASQLALCAAPYKAGWIVEARSHPHINITGSAPAPIGVGGWHSNWAPETGLALPNSG